MVLWHIYSLEEINTHSPLSTIALQTLYALVRSFLTWIEVLAISFTTRIASVSIPFHFIAITRAMGSVLVESGCSGARPLVGFVFAFRGGFVAHCDTSCD
jgi:hypothetical protein